MLKKSTKYERIEETIFHNSKEEYIMENCIFCKIALKKIKTNINFTYFQVNYYINIHKNKHYNCVYSDKVIFEY